MTGIQAPTATRPEAELAGSPAGGPDDGPPRPHDGAPVDPGWSAAPGPDGGRTVHIPALPYRRLGGFAFVGIAGLLTLFLVYLLAFTPLTAARDQQRLTGSLKGQPLTVYRLANGHLPAEGAAIGVLTIPAIGVDQVIVNGTSAADLMNGPGLMQGTSVPGTPGNSVVAARRVTFGAPFGSLGSLKRGDKVQVVDGVGTFTYKVTTARVVAIGHKDVVLPTADNRITLVTSNSSLVTSGRLVVEGKLVGRPVTIPDSTVSVPSYDLGLSGDPAAGGLAMMWSLLTVVVLVGAGLAAWRLRRPWLVYLFAAPVVVMCGLFACQSVARALPATF
jgi:sortase A